MKNLSIILLIVSVIAAPRNAYAQISGSTRENISTYVHEKNSPSISFVIHEDSELEIGAVASGIFSSANRLGKDASGSFSSPNTSLANIHFQPKPDRFSGAFNLSAYLDCIYPFHGFW